MIDWINILLEILSIILAVGSILLILFLMNKLAAINERKRKDTFICPKCGSLNIIHEKGPSDTYFIASLKSRNYFSCVDCGYEGECPLILKSEVSSFQKTIKNKNKSIKTKQTNQKIKRQKINKT